MNIYYPYLEFIKIVKECRNILIDDTLKSNSPDLFDALYSDANSKVYNIKLELYEIKWIEIHWKKINEIIENSECSLSEKKEMISTFSKLYKDYYSNWKYAELDNIIFEERINILKSLISVNSKWDNNLKRMKVLFEQQKKILDKKIKMFEMEE